MHDWFNAQINVIKDQKLSSNAGSLTSVAGLDPHSGRNSHKLLHWHLQTIMRPETDNDDDELESSIAQNGIISTFESSQETLISLRYYPNGLLLLFSSKYSSYCPHFCFQILLHIPKDHWGGQSTKAPVTLPQFSTSKVHNFENFLNSITTSAGFKIGSKGSLIQNTFSKNKNTHTHARTHTRTYTHTKTQRDNISSQRTCIVVNGGVMRKRRRGKGWEVDKEGRSENYAGQHSHHCGHPGSGLVQADNWWTIQNIVRPILEIM